MGEADVLLLPLCLGDSVRVCDVKTAIVFDRPHGGGGDEPCGAVAVVVVGAVLVIDVLSFSAGCETPDFSCALLLAATAAITIDANETGLRFGLVATGPAVDGIAMVVALRAVVAGGGKLSFRREAPCG